MHGAARRFRSRGRRIQFSDRIPVNFLRTFPCSSRLVGFKKKQPGAILRVFGLFQKTRGEVFYNGKWEGEWKPVPLRVGCRVSRYRSGLNWRIGDNDSAIGINLRRNIVGVQ